MAGSENEPAPTTSSPPKTRKSTRKAALLLGIGIAAIAGWVVLRARGKGPIVRFHRSDSPLEKLYAEREQFAGAWKPAEAPPGHRHLIRFPIPERVARELFPIDVREQPWDELSYMRHIPLRHDRVTMAEVPGGGWWMHTNALGMREDAEPLATKPDLRILVTGDSHTDGVCENHDSFPHVLQRELEQRHPGKTIEALNAGKGSFNFYNYLGQLEKFLDLKPDVFVVAVYGPNDFVEVLQPYHYFEGTDRGPGAAKYWPLVEKAIAIDRAWLAQDGLSLKYFQQYPDEIAVALRAAEETATDVQELCEAHGIQPVFVYLPGLLDTYRRSGGKDPKLEGLADRLYAAIEISQEDAAVHDRMGDEFLAFLAARKIPTLDVRTVFAGKAKRFYWLEDHHIDVDAQREIGMALAPILESIAAEKLR
jgi:lysophospholipase L1-like esterase